MAGIPKAFISHSSKDKHLATQIAIELGTLHCEFDEYTFDFILNGAAIRTALARSSLFVLILSQDSINSTFVKEELRGALESRAAGTIKQVLIFCIDQTSYKQLPDWMREINVAQHLRTAKQIARRIEASLTALSLDEGKMKDFYLPRDEQEESLRKLLAKPKRLVPNALHIVGNHGVGRKTFLRRTLSSLAPRQYEYPLSISVSEYDGLSEIFRKLYDLTEVSNPLVAGERFEKFRRAKENEKYTEIASLVTRLADDGCLLMFCDEGGVYQDNGDYKEHFLPLLEALNNAGRPVISFVQTRMMREIFKGKYPKSAHIRLPSLSDKQTYELMCLLLNELDVEYEETEVLEACKFADGHPFNVHFIATYICNEGMDITLADPGEILELNYQRGFDFISRINFNQIEGNVLALLREYRFCELEFILGALGDPPDLIEAIRKLEDYCVIERRDRILTIAPPLKDAIRRDARFRRDSIWSAQVAKRVIDSLSAFTADDNIPLSLIDSAIPELIRSGRDIPFIANLILPSHFLRVAREYYDHSKWSSAAEFCRKALELEAQLSKDARTEANRLLGLALVRLDTDNPEVAVVLRNLRHYATPTANRVALFIEGFRARRRGEYDIAEDRYLSAAALEPGNYHISRELSFVLCRVGRFAEAEPHARVAFRRSPDNPYILDVLIESLEGKEAQGLSVDRQEIQRLYDLLEAVCKGGGTQFYKIRQARRLYSQQSSRAEAFHQISEVIDVAMHKEDGLYRRATMYIRASQFNLARDDIGKLRDLGPEARRLADELDAVCLIGEGQFPEAKRFIETHFSGARSVAEQLERQLVRAISFSPSGLSTELVTWAKNYR